MTCTPTLAVILLGSMFMLSGSAPAQDLHVEGTVVYTAFATNGATMVSMSRQFSLDTSSNQWVVHAVRLAGPLDPRERWCEVAGDGTNIYSLMVLGPATNLPARGRFPVRRMTNDSGLGRIWQATVPFPGADFAAPVWFAYVKAASGQAPGKFKPLWFTDQETFYSPKLGMQAFVQTNPAAPYLPQRAWFVDSGRDIVSMFGKVLSLPTGSRPYTNASYTASNFVAVGRFALPRSFRLDAYAPDESRRGALYRYLSVVGTASGVSAEVSRRQFRPEVAVRTYVEDFRFSKGKGLLGFHSEDDEVPHLSYAITNDWIISTNEVVRRVGKRPE